MRPRRHLLIAALVIGLAFLGITLAWEQSSAYPSTWGDSTANAMGAALAVDLHARAGLTRPCTTSSPRPGWRSSAAATSRW